MEFPLIACSAMFAPPIFQRLMAGSMTLAIENPSTLELALIGVATIGVYALAKRSVQPRKDTQAVQPLPIGQPAEDPSREAA